VLRGRHLPTSGLRRSGGDPVVIVLSDVAGDLVKPVVEVSQPGVAGRSPRHGAGAGGRGDPGEGRGDVAGGDGPAGVVDHGVVVVLTHLVVLVPPRLPVSLGVVEARGVPLGSVWTRSLLPVGWRGLAR